MSEERRGGDDRGEEKGMTERGGGKMTEERRRGENRGEERGEMTEERREG